MPRTVLVDSTHRPACPGAPALPWGAQTQLARNVVHNSNPLVSGARCCQGRCPARTAVVPASARLLCTLCSCCAQKAHLVLHMCFDCTPKQAASQVGPPLLLPLILCPSMPSNAFYSNPFTATNACRTPHHRTRFEPTGAHSRTCNPPPLVPILPACIAAAVRTAVEAVHHFFGFF